MHHQQGDLQLAGDIYLRLLGNNATDHDALHLLGLIELQNGQPVTAIELIERAIVEKPDWAEARSNLAVAFNTLGIAFHRDKQLDPAVNAYRRAVELNPVYSEALSNLCVALSDCGQLDDAISTGRRSIALDPARANAHHNLAVALEKAGQIELAIDHQRQAIALDPRSAQRHFNLGNLLAASGKLDDAIDAFKTAVKQKDDYAAAFNNLGNVLFDTGQVHGAIHAYRQSVKIEPTNSSYASALLFSQMFDPDVQASEIAQKHIAWGRQFDSVAGASPAEPKSRLRIGYVSPDFREHPVARFLLPMLRNHDRTRFDICCYSLVSRTDATTQEICDLSDNWRDISSLTIDAAASLIRGDEVDLLIDLAGHSSNNRLPLFALKPAPVQISYLGYPATTGLPAINFRLTDAMSDPVGMTETLYSETLYRLPRSNWCFASPAISPSVVKPPVVSNDYITFGSFNRLAKITDTMLHAWARILHASPSSRLVLKANAFVAPSAVARVHDTFVARGIDLQRITLVGPLPDETSYLALANQIDIALDTFPYHGTKTTCDMLWMGVPTVTLAGCSHVSRVGVSLLHQVGLGDLVCSDLASYITTAVDLANHPARLIALRASLRDVLQSSPLMDASGFTREMETAFVDMWTLMTAR